MPQDEFYLGIPATLQVLPAPIAPIPSDSVIYNFKGVCAGLNQPGGVCFGTLTGALDAIEAAICSLQAGGGGGSGGGGVTLNCGTLSPLLTAGNCIPAATGAPGFIAGYAAAGAPLRYYPYTAPVAPLPDFISDCAGLLDKIKTCPPVSGTSVTTYLGFDSSGSPVKAPLPAVVSPTPFISNCADVNAKLKAIANGGCLPEDAVSATKVIAIDGLGNPIVRPISFTAPTQFISNCVDLRTQVGSCFTLQGTVLSTVLGRDAAGTVGYYPAPSGGGGGATSSVTSLDTSSIDMSVNQVGTIFQVSGTVIVSGAPGNILQSTAAGLFVPTPAGSTQFISDCTGFNAKLRSAANGGCLGTNAVAQTNYLAFDASGAPTIAPLPTAPVVPTPFIANCVDLLAKLKSTANGGCLPSSVVAQTNYLAVDGSGNATIAPLPAAPVIPAQFIPDCATFLTRHAPTTSGGCVTQDSTVASLVYAWDASANAMRLRPLPSSSTPFIANCTDFNSRLTSCPGTSLAAQTTYLAFDGSGNPVKAPLPVTPASFIGNCTDLLARLKSTANGGCLPTTGVAQTNYLAVDGAGNATIAPLPAVVVPTPFVANCTDFNARLISCPGTSAVSVATYLGYDAAGNPVKAPIPAAPASFISNCTDFLARLRSTANGGCLPEVLAQQPKNIAIDASGGAVIAPSSVRTATRWLLNSPAAATTLAVTGGGIVTASFADTEAVKNPAGSTASASTITIARDGYYDLSAAVLSRVSSATATPLNSAISLFGQVVVTRPAAAATPYRIGQQPIILSAIPAGVLATGIDYMFSGSVNSIWLPAGTTVQVQIQSANVASAGAYTYNLIQPIGGGQRLSVTERTANTAAI